MRHRRLTPPILLTVVFVSLVWWGSACAGEQTRATHQATPAGGVTLEAEPRHAGLVVLRSPTFR